MQAFPDAQILPTTYCLGHLGQPFHCGVLPVKWARLLGGLNGLTSPVHLAHRRFSVTGRCHQISQEKHPILPLKTFPAACRPGQGEVRGGPRRTTPAWPWCFAKTSSRTSIRTFVSLKSRLPCAGLPIPSPCSWSSNKSLSANSMLIASWLDFK